MSDEEMVAYLARCLVEPDAPRPSIETLLHAFLPAAHVDHVHADAICSLANAPDPEAAVHEALGDDVAVVPYLRPGFELSKRVADLADARAVVLAHHGLVTWGETHEESYGLTLELVARAAERLGNPTRRATRRRTSQVTSCHLTSAWRGCAAGSRATAGRCSRSTGASAESPIATTSRRSPACAARPTTCSASARAPACSTSTATSTRRWAGSRTRAAPSTRATPRPATRRCSTRRRASRSCAASAASPPRPTRARPASAPSSPRTHTPPWPTRSTPSGRRAG